MKTVVLADLYLKTSLNFCHLPAYLGNIFYPITERQVKIMELLIAIYLNSYPLERISDHSFSHLKILTEHSPTAEAYLIVVHVVRMVSRIISSFPSGQVYSYHLPINAKWWIKVLQDLHYTKSFRMGVEVNKAVSMAHGACSVLDDANIGSSKADVRLQHFHYHLRWSGTIDAF